MYILIGWISYKICIIYFISQAYRYHFIEIILYRKHRNMMVLIGAEIYLIKPNDKEQLNQSALSPILNLHLIVQIYFSTKFIAFSFDIFNFVNAIFYISDIFFTKKCVIINQSFRYATQGRRWSKFMQAAVTDVPWCIFVHIDSETPLRADFFSFLFMSYE